MFTNDNKLITKVKVDVCSEPEASYVISSARCCLVLDVLCLLSIMLWALEHLDDQGDDEGDDRDPHLTVLDGGCY